MRMLDCHRCGVKENECVCSSTRSQKMEQVKMLNGWDGNKLEQEWKIQGGFVLEVWLWLQFAIIVGMFLWAMARRGPKTVLEDAERRRVDMQRSSRR